MDHRGFFVGRIQQRCQEKDLFTQVPGLVLIPASPGSARGVTEGSLWVRHGRSLSTQFTR